MFESIQEQVNGVITGLVDEGQLTKRTKCHKWNLDPRALPSTLFFSEEVLVVPTNQVRSLDYYGGFEYVDKEYRIIVGDYTVFSSEAGRVENVINSLMGKDEDLDEDEE